MKKILLTGGNGMLATDFIKMFNGVFEIFSCNKNELDITIISDIEKSIQETQPDLVLNCAAYTAVDDAEDIGIKLNYDINTLGVYNLAKITAKYGVDFITISTDYVFDGGNKSGYIPTDVCNPINQYGNAKYLGEKLAIGENKNTIIIRTSWLYGGGKDFKNFVNTMINLSHTHNELKVVNDQFGIPTYTGDISKAIGKIIDNIGEYRGQIFHFSNTSEEHISWFNFAKEIFRVIGKDMIIHPCESYEYTTKAKRPEYSQLINNSDILLRDWKEGLRDYLKRIS